MTMDLKTFKQRYPNLKSMLVPASVQATTIGNVITGGTATTTGTNTVSTANGTFVGSAAGLFNTSGDVAPLTAISSGKAYVSVCAFLTAGTAPTVSPALQYGAAASGKILVSGVVSSGSFPLYSFAAQTVFPGANTRGALLCACSNIVGNVKARQLVVTSAGTVLHDVAGTNDGGAAVNEIVGFTDTITPALARGTASTANYLYSGHYIFELPSYPSDADLLAAAIAFSKGFGAMYLPWVN